MVNKKGGVHFRSTQSNYSNFGAIRGSLGAISKYGSNTLALCNFEELLKKLAKALNIYKILTVIPCIIPQGN
jgi:hypothetical protein